MEDHPARVRLEDMLLYGYRQSVSPRQEGFFADLKRLAREVRRAVDGKARIRRWCMIRDLLKPLREVLVPGIVSFDFVIMLVFV